MLNALITRHPTNRLTSSSLPSHSFFSSLPISTLNFLDRSNFAAKTREEKISFMKGLTSVLDRFSEGLRVRKVLPSLLEEVSIPSDLLGRTFSACCVADEGFAVAPSHSPKRLRHLSCALVDPIRRFGVAESEAFVRHQRSASEHVDAPEQCEDFAREN